MRADFTHTLWLDSNEQFLLRWVTQGNESVTFEVTGRAQGYIGFGLGANGGMRGADMAIVWVDDQGAGHISDRYGITNGYPLLDDQQDWQLVKYGKNDTHIWARIHRKQNTCDSRDFVIKAGDTVRALWAIGDAVPLRDDLLQKHSQRGSRSIKLFLEQSAKRLEEKLNAVPGVQAIDLHVDNVQIPHKHDTLYWCHIFKNDRPEMHVVAYDVFLNPPENRPFVHHLILYFCDDDAVYRDNKASGGWAGPCFPPDVQEEASSQADPLNPMRHCSSQPSVGGWAYGGEIAPTLGEFGLITACDLIHQNMAVVFPKDIGQPVFGKAKYYMLEMHYDNPNFAKNVVDNSGIRLYATERLQPIVAEQALFGMGVEAWNIVIPPRQKKFTLYSYCTSSCTKDFNPNGHYAFGGMMHTHLTGRQVKLRHIRNGRELKPILDDEHYDFNYQQTLMFHETVKILPGDEFIVECTYDTSDRQNATFGGPSTRDEMCLAYLNLYPSLSGDDGGFLCLSGLLKEDMIEFLKLPNLKEQHFGGSVLDEETNEEIPIRKYVNEKTNWRKDNSAKVLQKLWKDQRQGAICNPGGNWQLLYQDKIEINAPYIEPDSCDWSDRKLAMAWHGDHEKTLANTGCNDFNNSSFLVKLLYIAFVCMFLLHRRG